MTFKEIADRADRKIDEYQRDGEPVAAEFCKALEVLEELIHYYGLQEVEYWGPKRNDSSFSKSKEPNRRNAK